MKKIISLLAACTLFAVCLPVSAADAVTEDSALLQDPIVEQTDPYTFYFVPAIRVGLTTHPCWNPKMRAKNALLRFTDSSNMRREHNARIHYHAV